MTRIIPVQLGPRSYEVHIGHGLIARAGALLYDLVNGRRVVVVSDETVAARYGAPLISSLRKAGVEVWLLTLPPGEQTKSFAGLASLSEQLLELKLERGDRVIALGGGVIGDLAGFAAAIYKRGIDFIQIPTSLLAQVDSSVGGKTAIDTVQGKNMIGAFHQPLRVLADVDVLNTLPERELRCGYAEIIKYGLLGDGVFFEWLEQNRAAVLALEPKALLHAVGHSIAMKAAIVAEDERETGRRALLNLGHTFGHALELETGFGARLHHGEAVAMGSVLAFRFSAELGLCASADAGRVEAALASAGLPTGLREIFATPPSADSLINHMAQDKKAEAGRLVLVLARKIGAAFVAKDVELAALRAFWISQGAV